LSLLKGIRGEELIGQGQDPLSGLGSRKEKMAKIGKYRHTGRKQGFQEEQRP
jgi:hypothetical protein